METLLIVYTVIAFVAIICFGKDVYGNWFAGAAAGIMYLVVLVVGTADMLVEVVSEETTQLAVAACVYDVKQTANWQALSTAELYAAAETTATVQVLPAEDGQAIVYACHAQLQAEVATIG